MIKISKKNAVSIMERLHDLIDIIKVKSDKMDCDMHRVVLFCGKHGSSRNKEVDNGVMKKVTELGIVVDCILVTSTHRPNKDIERVCRVNDGKVWTPSVNVDEWNRVVTCDDFMYPHMRSVGRSEAIVID